MAQPGVLGVCAEVGNFLATGENKAFPLLLPPVDSLYSSTVRLAFCSEPGPFAYVHNQNSLWQTWSFQGCSVLPIKCEMA